MPSSSVERTQCRVLPRVSRLPQCVPRLVDGIQRQARSRKCVAELLKHRGEERSQEQSEYCQHNNLVSMDQDWLVTNP